MDNKEDSNEVVVPVVAEELHADAIPVQTGGVRVTKRVEGHDEIIEQELRKGRVEIKRIKTDRVVDGPQPVHRSGNTLIIPVVAEVLRVQKEWVVTEEIHLTQVEERETVQQNVRVNREEARIERLDEEGQVVSSVEPELQPQPGVARSRPETVVGKRVPRLAESASAPKKQSSRPRSLLRNRPDEL